MGLEGGGGVGEPGEGEPVGGVSVGKIVGGPGSAQEEARRTTRSIKAKIPVFAVLFALLNSFLTIFALICCSASIL